MKVGCNYTRKLLFWNIFSLQITYCTGWLLSVSTENIAVILSCLCPVFFFLTSSDVDPFVSVAVWLAYLNRLAYCLHYWFVLRGNYSVQINYMWLVHCGLCMAVCGKLCCNVVVWQRANPLWCIILTAQNFSGTETLCFVPQHVADWICSL